MNVYDRIINILLEASVDMFIQDRLDEAKLKGKQGKLDVNKNKKLDAEDFKMLRSGKRADEASEQAKANKAKQKALKQDRGHRVDKLLKGRFSDGGISANALKLAGEARKSGNKPEAQRQVGRSQKMPKPQIP
jgi:hypothetical protein